MRKAAEDPFREHEPARLRARLHVMGGVFTVESGDAELLDLAVEAFGGMPKHRLQRKPHHFTVRLVRTAHAKTWRNSPVPPQPVLSAGAGLLCAAVDAGNFAVVDVPMSRALLCMSNAMLRHRYHARYELVELVFLTLAARAQSLVPLHAACAGANGNCVLLMGASGTGKSTLSLHALAGGMQLVSEDSAFVELDGNRVTGVPNYLHLGPQALRFLQSRELRRSIESSPVIERAQRGAQVRGRSAHNPGQDRSRAAAARGDRFFVAASGWSEVAAAHARARSSARATAARAALRISAAELERVRAEHRRRAGVRAASDRPRRRGSTAAAAPPLT